MKNRIARSVLGNCIILFIALILVGCKVELYSGMGESEGNEMLAILLDGGIAADKIQDKDKNLTLMIKTEDVAKAIRLLKSYGYPKDKFLSIGDIFPKEGLISSPTEERARYTYSMSQELSSTLSMIDGVITARVHVVLPQKTDSLTEMTYPSSASIFIKYTPELELSGFIPKVKSLVAHSIDGLSLDKISVSLFPAARIGQVGVSGQSGGNKVGHKTDKVLIFIAVLFMSLVLFGVLFFVFNKKAFKSITSLFRKKSKNNHGDDSEDDMQIEIY
ncbi:MAG: type III secretion inner membrane ring lipoprotein SctJ [Candidatus Endonucleobacter bathymodioli]|uniref:Lipoprotein n=1 Tax=Candidatus Endonucleibacter bathymodioli TaxID=539814 RepID=A0AA90NK71_9GAMM|nr:type III secretion inner membrane ring lipoprotein SctJ [Candidatus Endonucleobacter bathymodioli]